MTDPTLIEELARAIPVVVGGLLAVGGGLFGQVVTHRLTMKRERSKIQRERLESFVKAIYAHSQWLDEKRNTMIFANSDHDVASPLDEARMIQALHFPELLDAILAVQQTQMPLLDFIGKQRIARMQNQETWLAAWDNEPYNAAYKQYLLAVGLATMKCRKVLLALPES